MTADLGGALTWPTVSVVIPTRNRPDHVLACAQAILRGEGFIELLVVDQSEGGGTEIALAAIRDPRLRHIRSSLRGATNARNVGIDRSKGTVVAFTDDDCRAAPDWVLSVARIFATDPDAAVVCGRVEIPTALDGHGYAAAFAPVVREWQTRFPPPGQDWGITANLAVRRDVLARVGNFDPLLGVGAPLQSGEEPDFLYRVLKAGLKVVNATEVRVDHVGIRMPGAETRALWRTYAVGTAAALFKYVRLREVSGTKLYLRWLWASTWRVVSSIANGTRPIGIRFLLAFLYGSLASFRFDIDPHRRQYVRRVS